MKKILGLDLGTNSIGWAVVNKDNDGNPANIEMAGSRIIPMDASILGDFNKGNSVSQTKERTGFRGTRRLIERNLLRRERLCRVLRMLEFLPPHFSNVITRYGKFKVGTEPKLAWVEDSNGKYTFLFKDSFDEMVADFKSTHPELFYAKANGEETKIPYDWTIYYLRKKALKEKISKAELAWIILNFNQKRGYYQLRGEDEEEITNKLVEYHALKVVSVEDSGEKKGKDTWYNIHLENGWVYRRTSSVYPDWVGKTKGFIVTTMLDKDGNPQTDKDGNVKQPSLRVPKDDDWTLVKKKTEHDIAVSHTSVGEYIYNSLLSNPNQKIRGKLVRTIERKFYKSELIAILNKQKEFHSELRDSNLYGKCIDELYPNNDNHRTSIASRDFCYLFVEDIIFYQRPLKSKKSLIDNCPYEQRKDADGNIYPVKCIAKSNPLFQEFRLWQFVANLRILQNEKIVNGKLRTDVDVTSEFLKDENDYEALFEWLNDRKEIKQDILLSSFFKIKKSKGKDSAPCYRWNYVTDKAYKCNDTRAAIISRLAKIGVPLDFLDKEYSDKWHISNEKALWHILYSVEDKYDVVKALKTFASKKGLNEDFVEIFSKFPPFKKEYGAYSEKALNRLLPLMRVGKYWNEANIDAYTLSRINKIIDGEYDESIRNRVREKAINLRDISHFRGLPLWLACYIVYDRHSEAKDITKWESPDDITKFLAKFKQHSLRNPIVEQVITETLRTVRDIWKKVYKNDKNDKIDEIHIEMGREMKNPADKRAKMTSRNIENENTNLRIKTLLLELQNEGVSGVRPFSPGQQEIMKIYEEYALNNINPDDKDIDFITSVSKKANPTSSELQRYKLWLEQKYRSPYTDQIIPLSKLFTHEYEIEHIIPQSRYFDDSLSNKVICESEVNKLKDNSLGYEFIKNHAGEVVTIANGRNVKILGIDAYEQFVKNNYKQNRAKMRKLLMDDIPDAFIERQMNDSRYISKVVKSLLSNMVRLEGEQDDISKNVITCNGSITDRLKKEWGVNNVWNNIIINRFKRMNQLWPDECFTTTNAEGKTIPNMPLEYQKGFNKKRIDHRHHAMDAIVIACTTRNHVNLLNNESAMSKSSSTRYSLSKKLRRYENVQVLRNGEYQTLSVAKEFLKPWDSFATDVKIALDNIVVSFKKNLRVINKTKNYYQHFVNGKKVVDKQTKGDNWAVRKPMHKDTVFGEVNLRMTKTVGIAEAVKRISAIVNKDLKLKLTELVQAGYNNKQIKQYFADNVDAWSDVDIAKIKIYYFTNDTNDRYFATRKVLDTSFDADTIKSSITDTGIQKILLRHLADNENDPVKAFSPEGIEEMNKNIKRLNDGFDHKPILKVRKYEKAEKFAVGNSGNKSSKFVESAKGTNLFFAVYENEVKNKNTGEIEIKRTYTSIPLRVAIERQKNGLPLGFENEFGNMPSFILSPNDLVYIPTHEHINIADIDKSRIYKVVSFDARQCFFIQYNMASPIVDKREMSPKNKMERAVTGEMIKEICIPLKINRLGEIVEV